MSTSVGSIHYDLDLKTDQFEKKTQEVNQKLKSLSSGLNDLGSGMKDAGVAMTAAFTAPILALGAFGIASARQIQTAAKQMEALTGSSEKANAIIGELYNFVLGKPIKFPDATQAASTLLGYGRTSGQVVADMKTLSTMAIVNGADLQALALVYGQVTSRGALFGQDALQLINNKIPLASILAKELGISMQEASEKINGGKISAEQFTKAMDAYAKSLDISKFTDSLDNRMISLQGSLRSLSFAILGIKIDPVKGFVVEAGGLFDTFSNFVSKAAKAASEFAKWFRELNPVQKKLVTGFIIFLSVIGPLLMIFGTFITALASFLSVIGTIAGIIGVASTVLLGWIAVIAIVIAAIVALAVAIVWNWDKIKAWTTGLWDSIKKGFSDGVQSVTTWFANVFTAIGNFFNAIPGVVSAGVSAVISFLMRLPETIAFMIGYMVGAYYKFWTQDVPMALMMAVNFLTNFVTVTIPNWFNSLMGWFQQIPGRVSAYFSQMYQSIVAWFNNAANSASNSANNLVNWVAGVFRSLPGVASQVISNIAGFFQQLPGKIIGALGNLGGMLYDKLKSIASSAWEGFKRGMGIRSPSFIEKSFMAISGQASTTIDDLKYTMGSLNSMAANNLPKIYGANYSATVPQLSPAYGTVKGGDTYVNIGTVQDRADAQYIVNSLNRSYELAEMGMTP